MIYSGKTVNGFTARFWRFCQDNGFDPKSVSSVARWNAYLCDRNPGFYGSRTLGTLDYGEYNDS